MSFYMERHLETPQVVFYLGIVFGRTFQMRGEVFGPDPRLSGLFGWAGGASGAQGSAPLIPGGPSTGRVLRSWRTRMRRRWGGAARRRPGGVRPEGRVGGSMGNLGRAFAKPAIGLVWLDGWSDGRPAGEGSKVLGSLADKTAFAGDQGGMPGPSRPSVDNLAKFAALSGHQSAHCQTSARIRGEKITPRALN